MINIYYGQRKEQRLLKIIWILTHCTFSSTLQIPAGLDREDLFSESKVQLLELVEDILLVKGITKIMQVPWEVILHFFSIHHQPLQPHAPCHQEVEEVLTAQCKRINKNQVHLLHHYTFSFIKQDANQPPQDLLTIIFPRNPNLGNHVVVLPPPYLEVPQNVHGRTGQVLQRVSILSCPEKK